MLNDAGELMEPITFVTFSVSSPPLWKPSTTSICTYSQVKSPALKSSSLTCAG